MMITTLLIDLVDTIVTLPYRPRDVLWRLLGFSGPDEVECIAYSLCLESPGMTAEDFIRRFTSIVGVNGDIVLQQRIRDAWEVSACKAEFIYGARETLKKLKAAGYTLVLVSNTTPPTKKTIAKLGLDKLMDSIVLSCDVGVLKPRKEIFRVATGSVGAAIKQACVVGDSWETDIAGALRLGMKAVHVDGRYDAPEIKAVKPSGVAAIPNISFLPTVLERNREMVSA